MMTGLKYQPIKAMVGEKLPKILFYKASGRKSNNCAKGAEGLYNVVNTETGKSLGSFKLSLYEPTALYTGVDIVELGDVLHSNGYFEAGINKRSKWVKLPFSKEYRTTYDIYADENQKLDSMQQYNFAEKSLAFLKNISDKFKHPILLRDGYVPESMLVAAMRSGEYIAIPYAKNTGKRAVDGQELYQRFKYFKPSRDYPYIENTYNEKTYRNMDNYLRENEISSLVYAEYAIHPETKKPNIKTAINEFCIRLKDIFAEIKQTCK